MNQDINTRDYWHRRFESGDWERSGGRRQTEGFAKSQQKYLKIAPDFGGTILDFGCGLGDAIPVYRSAYPKARIIGLDIAESAIRKCRNKYGKIATFIQGDYRDVVSVDIIIASNVLEHLKNDREVVKSLMGKCATLYVVVPYKEWPLCAEHVHSYDEDYFATMGRYDWKVIESEAWGQSLWGLWYEVYFLNVFRWLAGNKLHSRRKQIIFRFENRAPAINHNGPVNG